MKAALVNIRKARVLILKFCSPPHQVVSHYSKGIKLFPLPHRLEAEWNVLLFFFCIRRCSAEGMRKKYHLSHQVFSHLLLSGQVNFLHLP